MSRDVLVAITGRLLLLLVGTCQECCYTLLLHTGHPSLMGGEMSHLKALVLRLREAAGQDIHQGLRRKLVSLGYCAGFVCNRLPYI